MKRFVPVAVVFAAVLTAGAASAADVRPRAVQPAPVYKAPDLGNNWSGFYLGANGSIGTYGGGLGGGQVGYNWQTGNTVLGIESDIGWGNLKASNGGIEQSWLGSTRARLGYALGRFLPYVTGGVAYGDVRTTQPTTSGTTTRAGWTAGGGVEYGIDRNWSAKIEYQHLDLGTATFMGAAANAPSFSQPVRDDLVRAGLNYKW